MTSSLCEERPDPVFVPPMVVYLASDLAANVNGYIFRVGAGKIALYSHPTEIRGIYRNYKKDGPWPVEELIKVLPPQSWQGKPVPPTSPEGAAQLPQAYRDRLTMGVPRCIGAGVLGVSPGF